MAQLVKMMNGYIYRGRFRDPGENMILPKLRTLLDDDDEWRNDPELDVNRPCVGIRSGGYDYALWCGIKMENPLDVCRFLLRKGASVDLPMPDHQFQTEKFPTTLHKVCRESKLDLMQRIYHHIGDTEEFLRLMSIRNYLGQSPCWYAVSVWNPPLVDWLVQIGCDFGETDASGRTNLTNAIYLGSREVLQSLLPYHRDALEFKNFYEHPLTMAIHLSRRQILTTLRNHLLEAGKIKKWEAKLLSHCIGAKRFKPNFFDRVKEEGLLPFEIIVPIIIMSCQPDIIELYFERFLSRQSPEFIADLLNKKYIAQESLIHSTYGSWRRKLPQMPRILHFLLKHGADAQEIRIFTNQLVNRDLDSAAVLLSGGLRLYNQNPEYYPERIGNHDPDVDLGDNYMQIYTCDYGTMARRREDRINFMDGYNPANDEYHNYESRDQFKNWNELFDHAAVDDQFLYILWASGHEAMVKDYLRTKENDLVNRNPDPRGNRNRGPWRNRTPLPLVNEIKKPSPLVNQIKVCLSHLGAETWFIRGKSSLVGNTPSLSLECIQQIRKTLSSQIFYKVRDLGIPHTLKSELQFGVNNIFS